MKCLLNLVLFAGVGCCAQVSENGPSIAAGPNKVQPQTGTVLLCKLESVTWNPQTEELSWVISMRDIGAGTDQPAARKNYTIHLDTAVMSSNGEGRRFDADEAQQVSRLMEVISAYTVESTVWWSKGLGEKINGNEGIPAPDKEPDKPKTDQPKPVPVPRGPTVRVAAPLAETNLWHAQ
jgi:hypothetical protein